MANGKNPTDRNRIVIEGVDEPKRPEFSDRVRIDPFRKRYLDKRLGLRKARRRT